MKVSLITACYNSENSILETIISVNNQSYENLEHIFIDGNSSDGTLDIINSESTRTKNVLSEKDRGIYDALNKGLNLATGDIIGLVHSDDILASDNIIEEIVAKFQSNDCDGVYGDLIYVNKENINDNIRYWKSNPFNIDLLNKGWMPPHPTLYLKKKVYDQVGRFDLTFKIAADYDFILRVFKNTEFSFFYLPEVICKMRIGGESNRNLTNILTKSREDLIVLRKNDINYPIYPLIRKNISKIPQFFKKN